MDLVLTSKLGTFTFDEGMVLSKAKLIRDAITGQFFNPRQGEPRITSEKAALEYAMRLDRDLADIPFELHFHSGITKNKK